MGERGKEQLGNEPVPETGNGNIIRRFVERFGFGKREGKTTGSFRTPGMGRGEKLALLASLTTMGFGLAAPKPAEAGVNWQEAVKQIITSLVVQRINGEVAQKGEQRDVRDGRAETLASNGLTINEQGQLVAAGLGGESLLRHFPQITGKKIVFMSFTDGNGGSWTSAGEAYLRAVCTQMFSDLGGTVVASPEQIRQYSERARELRANPEVAQATTPPTGRIEAGGQADALYVDVQAILASEDHQKQVQLGRWNDNMQMAANRREFVTKLIITISGSDLATNTVVVGVGHNGQYNTFFHGPGVTVENTNDTPDVEQARQSLEVAAANSEAVMKFMLDQEAAAATKLAEQQKLTAARRQTGVIDPAPESQPVGNDGNSAADTNNGGSSNPGK